MAARRAGMAERNITERLQPSLLDRLTDDAPGDRAETPGQRVIDLRRLREIIRRDLTWLLNTTNHESLLEAESGSASDAWPHVTRSVINYGVRELSGDFATGHRASAIRDSIALAIEVFEPRLRPGTLEVRLVPEAADRQTVLVYDILAEMWAQPVPMELYLRSQFDTDTGEIRLEHRG